MTLAFISTLDNKKLSILHERLTSEMLEGKKLTSISVGNKSGSYESLNFSTKQVFDAVAIEMSRRGLAKVKARRRKALVNFS